MNLWLNLELNHNQEVVWAAWAVWAEWAVWVEWEEEWED
jgi:hypothetical protein